METISLKEFMSKKSFSQIIPVVRRNTNGYAFLTFTSSDNKAENIYFSRTMSDSLTEGEKTTIDFLRSLKACNTVNAAGESRWKLTDSAGSRVELADL
jgi:uncharacterized protein YbcV (DUF1398 family)